MFQKTKQFLFRNTNTKQTVAKNTFWLTVSNFGGRLVKAGVIIYAARVLGTAGYGVFSYAITLAGFLTLFMDPGINWTLVRETAKADEARRRTLFSTTFALKSVLIVAGVAIIIYLAPLFSTLPGAKAVLPIVALVLAFDTLRDFFTSVMRAKEQMEWDAAIYVLTNFGILIFGFIFLSMAATARSFAWAYVAGDVLGIAFAAFLIRRYFKDLVGSFSAALIGPILRTAWPFALTGALGALLTNADLLILSWMRSASEVGIYSAAIRIVQLLYLVPTVLQFSTMPVLARLAKKEPERFRTVLERITKVILMAAIPFGIGGAILAGPIMQLMFGSAYASGGPTLSLLLIGLIFDFPAVLIAGAIFAYDHQKSLIVTTAIAGITNVTLDLILIPPFGMLGSAVGTLITQIISNWYLWHVMKKINYFEVLPRLKRSVAAGIVMGAAVAALAALGVEVVLAVIAGGIVYAGALITMREPVLREIRNIMRPEEAIA